MLSGPFADGEATARFTTPEAAKEVRDLHAGKARVQLSALEASAHMLEISMSHIIADCVSQSAYHSAAHALCQSLSRFVRLSTCWEAACAVSTGSTGPPAGTLQRRLGRRRPSSPRRRRWLPAATATAGCLPMLLGLASAAATATAGCRSSGGLGLCPQPMAWALYRRLRGLSKGGRLMQGASMPVTLPLRSLPLQGQHGLLQSRRPCATLQDCPCMVCQGACLRKARNFEARPQMHQQCTNVSACNGGNSCWWYTCVISALWKSEGQPGQSSALYDPVWTPMASSVRGVTCVHSLGDYHCWLRGQQGCAYDLNKYTSFPSNLRIKRCWLSPAPSRPRQP